MGPMVESEPLNLLVARASAGSACAVRLALVAGAIVLAACGDGSSKDRGAASAAASSPPGPPTSTGVTIRMGPDGRSQVEGSPAPSGSPAACTGLRACCSAPQVSLFCSLTQAAGGTCEQQLASVQAHLAETGTAKPAGCP